jgi:hypothetical protein
VIGVNHAVKLLLSLPGIAVVDANDLRLILKDAGHRGISGSYSEWVTAHQRLTATAVAAANAAEGA